MPPERAGPPQGGHRGQGAAARRDQARHLRVPDRPLLRRRGAAGLQHAHQVDAPQRHRVRAPSGGPRAPPPLRDGARRADAVRLEGVPAHGRRRRRGVRVQRLRGHAGLLPAPPVRLLQDAHRGRRHGVPAGGDGRQRRHGAHAGHRQHVLHRLVLRLGAARLGALRQVRRRGGLRAGAGAAEEPADQGQGGVVEPVPVEAGRLRGRLPRRGGARGRHRAHRGAVQHRAQRVDRGAAGGAVHAREGGAAQGGQHGASGVDGGRRLRPGGAPHDARPLPGPRVLGAPALHRQARQGARDAVGPGEGGDGRRDRRGSTTCRPREGRVVYDPAHYAEALAAKARYADADIEAAARANLELLGRLGEGSL